MTNTDQILLIVLTVIVFIWIVLPMFDCKSKEGFEICDSDGNCRSPDEFMNDEGLVAGQPNSNIEKAYEVKDNQDSEADSQKETAGRVSIDKLDDGLEGDAGLLYAPCSTSCCTPQYPPPFKVSEDKNVCMNKDKYVPSGYKCNNAWNNSGCLCMTKQQSNFLASRGGNNA